jgi:hypothetical protein
MFAVSTRYFRKFGGFGPPDLLQVVVNAARELPVDRHQVIRFAPGRRSQDKISSTLSRMNRANQPQKTGTDRY